MFRSKKSLKNYKKMTNFAAYLRAAIQTAL